MVKIIDRGLIALCASLLLIAPAGAWAKPQLALRIEQLREVADPGAGVGAMRWVPTREAHPGDVVQYVLHYANTGDEAARDARIGDPIPAGTVYLAGSAKGEGAEITFSSDGGKTYASPVSLTYEITTPSGAVEKRIAQPSDYTHVRFTLRSVAPGASGSVSFQVRVN